MKIAWTRNLTILSLAVSGFMGLAAPAFASGWEISIDTEGSGTQYAWSYTHYNALPPGPGLSKSGSSSSGPAKGLTAVLASTCTSDGSFVNGYAHTGVTAHGTLHWKRNNLEYGGGSDPNDNPPKIVYYAEDASAWADAWRGYYAPFDTLDLTATLDNGGSLGGTRISDGPETADVPYGKNMYGHYLNQIKVTSDTVVLPSRTFSSDIIVPSCINGVGQFRTGADYSVTVPSFAISSDIEASYHKQDACDGQSQEAIPALDINPPDNKVLNSVMHWWVGNDQINYTWKSDASYTISTDVFSKPNYAWSVSGAGAIIPPSQYPYPPDADYLLNTSTPRKIIRVDFGADTVTLSKGNITNTVQVIVSDTGSNAMVGPAKVTVKWHMPYEKTVDLGSQPRTTMQGGIAGPLAPGEGAVKVSQPAEDFNFGATLDDVAVLFLGANEETSELIKAATGLSKLVFHFDGIEEATPPNFWRNDNGSWVPATRENPCPIDGATPEELADPYGYSAFNMEIYKVKHSHDLTWLADKYGTHGFESANHKFGLNVVDSIDEEPRYYRKGEY